MARLVLWFLALLVVAAGIAVGAYVWFGRAVSEPGPLRTATTVIIAPGTGTPAIARQLASDEVIHSPLVMELKARRTGKSRAVKLGVHRFDPAGSIDGVRDKI